MKKLSFVCKKNYFISSNLSFAYETEKVFLLKIKSIGHQQQQQQQQKKWRRKTKFFMASCVLLTLGQVQRVFLPGHFISN